MKCENINNIALVVRAAESDIDVAVRLAGPLIRKGDPSVLWYLGYLCQCGLYNRSDESAALSWFKRAADLGSAMGKSALAALDAAPTETSGYYLKVDRDGITHLEEGWPEPAPYLGFGQFVCTHEDCERIFSWYLDAAKGGDPEMQLLIGMLYEHGIHVHGDPTTALGWYERAIESGLHEAKLWHSRLDLRRHHQEETRKWFAERSELIDRLFEALRRRLGPGPNDEEAAFQWYFKLSEEGDPDAQIEVSRRYDLGMGVKKNRSLAFTWLSIASARHPEDIVRRILQSRVEWRGVHIS